MNKMSSSNSGKNHPIKHTSSEVTNQQADKSAPLRSSPKSIRLYGVKQNNLKDIDVQIPLGSFTVLCGPSGSGKSSLAFETLYAEGQRRYIESLSNYTKQFLNKAPKPDVERVENIPPALALEQKNGVKNSRSTVGTTTELLDYMRLLFEKLGHAYCPDHHLLLSKDNVYSASEKVLHSFDQQRGYILCKIPEKGRLLEGRKLYAQLLQDGFIRLYIPSLKKIKENPKSVPYSRISMGKIIELSDSTLKKSAPKKEFYILIDRMAFKKEEQGRLIDSLRQAYTSSTKYLKENYFGTAYVLTTEGHQLRLSEDNSCSRCEYSFPQIHSQLFSFNSAAGACPHCKGFGNLLSLDEAKVIPNPERSVDENALEPFSMPSAVQDRKQLIQFCKKNKIPIDKPWNKLTIKQREKIWKGTDKFYGVEGLFEYLETKKYKMHVRVFISRYKSPRTCEVCQGTRLRHEAAQVFVAGQSIISLSQKTLEDLKDFFEKTEFSKTEEELCKEVFRQLRRRLKFLCDVGVGYLTIDRLTRSLSGGEYQRLNLSNQLGMELSQTLYVLDEPTVGLHPRDNDRLITVLKNLNQLGNTLVVVEHDHDVIKSCNYIMEMGPGSGYLGGEVIFAGTQGEFLEFENSNTLGFLKPNAGFVAPRSPRPIEIENYRYKLELEGCTGNNLKNVHLTIPLNRLVTLTGVSGSGKSTLISHTLYPAVARKLGVEFIEGFPFQTLSGTQHFKQVLLIDQTPIGKTARSNCMTYLKIYDAIREIFANQHEAKAAGYTPGTFSLNVDGGRCPVCKGLGYEIVDMMFMDDIHIPCEACDGKKFRHEVLGVQYKKKNISDVMNLTVAEAMNFFVAYPNIRRPLSILKEVGLDYIRLGQSASSLSGGESQRLKVAKELNLAGQKPTLYILDEPTTGLHFKEVNLLMKVLNQLIDTGNSVILIEHNQDVIRGSDWVIDIGPEAGSAGGQIVFSGPPDSLIKKKNNLTGQYLKKYIEDLTPRELLL